MIGRTDTKLRVGAPGPIDDEVGKGFVEGSNRSIDVLLEGEERVNRGNTSSVSKSRSVVIVDGERGFVARIMTPSTERTLGSSSGSSSPNAP